MKTSETRVSGPESQESQAGSQPVKEYKTWKDLAGRFRDAEQPVKDVLEYIARVRREW